MMKISLTLLLSVLSFYFRVPQPQQNSMEPISKIEWCVCNNVTPEESDILDFLRIIASLTNEVETTEYSNELLFTLLNDYPYVTIVAIADMQRAYRDKIYAQLHNPIHDRIDVSSIYEKLKSIHFETLKHKLILRKVQQIIFSLENTI